MRLLIVVICCLGALATATDQQADSSEVQSTNKLTAAKSSLNAIPSAPAQKTTLIQQQQSHQQYIPQYVVQKPVSIPSQHQHQHQHHNQQQPAAMYIIAQPSGHQHQPGSQNTLFQQAVQQLLSYYSNNPQARYQLLQQQGGNVPQHQQITHAHPVPQPAQHTQSAQTVQQAHSAYQHHHQMPTGALHVIPSPHLDNSNHLAQSQNQNQQQVQLQVAQPAQTHQTSSTNQPQAIYAIPASSQYTLSQLSPGLLAQLTGHSTPQHQTVPVQLPAQYSQHLSGQSDLTSQLQLGSQLSPQLSSQLSHQLSPQFGSQFGSHLSPQFGSQLGGAQLGGAQLGGAQLNGAQFFTQLPSNFGGQFANQLPQHFALPAQFQGGYQHLQPQFTLKQNSGSNGNEYVAHVVQQNAQTAQPIGQSEKNNQPQSSNYNPVYKTAYIKG